MLYGISFALCLQQPLNGFPLYKHGFTSLFSFTLLGDESQELGPPPSVDEAANTLMTRLGFLLGDKVNEGPGGAQYNMEEQDDPQVWYMHLMLYPVSIIILLKITQVTFWPSDDGRCFSAAQGFVSGRLPTSKTQIFLLSKSWQMFLGFEWTPAVCAGVFVQFESN